MTRWVPRRAASVVRAIGIGWSGGPDGIDPTPATFETAPMPRPVLVLPLLVAMSLPAQGDRQAALEAKLAAPFLRRAEWTTDFATARRSAAERGQLILGYFTTAGP